MNSGLYDVPGARDLQRGGARQLIGFSGDKAVEAEFWNEAERSRAELEARGCARADRGRGSLIGSGASAFLA